MSCHGLHELEGDLNWRDKATELSNHKLKGRDGKFNILSTHKAFSLIELSQALYTKSI